MAAERPDADLRVLLVAPTPRDGEVTRGVLAASGIACMICPSLDHLCREAVAGAARYYRLLPGHHNSHRR